MSKVQYHIQAFRIRHKVSLLPEARIAWTGLTRSLTLRWMTWELRISRCVHVSPEELKETIKINRR